MIETHRIKIHTYVIAAKVPECELHSHKLLSIWNLNNVIPIN